MKADELEFLRKNQKRTPLVVANQLSKLYEDSMYGEENSILKEKTARIILIYLSYKNGVTQQELVRVTQMKGSTVSVAISKMEKQELVRREENENDMRSVKIFITDKGRRLEAEIEAFLKANEKKLMKGIPEKDIKIALYVLERMIDNLIK